MGMGIGMGWEWSQKAMGMGFYFEGNGNRWERDSILKTIRFNVYFSFVKFYLIYLQFYKYLSIKT